jgi:urease accessory protein UreH
VFDIIAQLAAHKHVCQRCLLEPSGAIISGDKLMYQLIS